VPERSHIFRTLSRRLAGARDARNCVIVCSRTGREPLLAASPRWTHYVGASRAGDSVLDLGSCSAVRAAVPKTQRAPGFAIPAAPRSTSGPLRRRSGSSSRCCSSTSWGSPPAPTPPIPRTCARVAGLVGVSVIGVVVAGMLAEETFAANTESVRAFHQAVVICAALVAAGGIAGAIGITNPRRAVKAESCAGGQLVGTPEPAVPGA
jgi:hypothetical protein